MTYLALIVVTLAGLIVPISSLMRRHSAEVYVIWYIFSLSTIIFSTSYYLAEQAGVDLPNIFGPAWVPTLQDVYKLFTDFKQELVLVACFVVLSILPQFLAYFFSMWSGSATSPILVRQVGFAAIMSLVKFMAVWSGLVLGHPLAQLWLSGIVNKDELSKAIVTLVISFYLAYVWHEYTDKEFSVSFFPAFRVSIRMPALARFLSSWHNWATRNTKKKYVSLRFDDNFYFQTTRYIFGPAVAQPCLDSDDKEDEWVFHNSILTLVLKGLVAIYIRDLYQFLKGKPRASCQ